MATIAKPIAITTAEDGHSGAPEVDYYDNDFLYDPLTEYVDYENLYLFQTDIEDLRKLLPEGTKPLKIAAGKGLFGLGMQNFVPGQFTQFKGGKPGEIQKIYAVIAIEPDYDIKMATPRFCFFALRVVTTDTDLNDLTYDINKAPIYRTSGLTIAIDKENYTASASDDDGPIFEITTPFRHKAFSDLNSWGQNATLRDGSLYWQAWHWKGSGLEFFMNGKLGTFHDHPFLRGLNISDLTCRHVFVAEGGVTSTMALYKPVPKDDVEEHDDRSMREISKEFSDAIEKRIFGTRLQDPNYYYNRLRECLAGGIHYNFHGFPLKFLSMQIKKGKGARVWDERGVEYLDLYGKFGALFLGHNHPYYNEKLKECIDQITVVDSSGLEQRAAEYLIKHIPSAELVRFSQSGTEAVQNAVRLARAYTGKERIVRFYGHYHGNADNLMGGKADNVERPYPKDYTGDVFYTEGRAANIFRDQVFVTLWNETSLLEMLLKENQDEIAALIMEPICINGGGIMPEPGYLEKVVALCRKYNVLLILDEVITGIRCGLGGAQSLFGVTPDICVYGKAVAGGAVPVSVIMGRREIMDMYAQFRAVHGGTFNGYPLGMAGIIANFDILEKEGDYYPRVCEKANKIIDAFKRAGASYGIPIAIQGPPTGITFHVNDAELDSSLQFNMGLLRRNLLMNIVCMEHGIVFSPISRMYSSLQLTDEDVIFFEERIGDAMKHYSEIYEDLTK